MKDKKQQQESTAGEMEEEVMQRRKEGDGRGGTWDEMKWDKTKKMEKLIQRQEVR